MSLPVFTWKPDWAPQIDEAPKVTKTAFGDSYTQRAGDGINNLQPTVAVSFTVRTRAEYEAIRDFLRARGATDPFLFTSPHESIQRKWVCEAWKATPWQNGDNHSISATFEAQP